MQAAAIKVSLCPNNLFKAIQAFVIVHFEFVQPLLLPNSKATPTLAPHFPELKSVWVQGSLEK